MLDTSWPPHSTSGNRFHISGEEIHVWRASLVAEPELFDRLQGTLSPDERSRAARLVARRDSQRFTIARGILRKLLAAYLHRPAASLTFDYGPFGKPGVKELDDAGAPIRFNASHSHDLFACCLSKGREIGIDVERLNSSLAGEDIARSFFSPSEVTELLTLPPELRAEGFFNCWTRKEAYVKARGGGLQIPLDSFSVSLTPGRHAELNSADAARWTLLPFEPAWDYAGALVAEGKDWTARFFEWRP
jgi:4'-phosphopantetheinyl transferase